MKILYDDPEDLPCDEQGGLDAGSYPSFSFSKACWSSVRLASCHGYLVTGIRQSFFSSSVLCLSQLMLIPHCLSAPKEL